MQGKKVVINTYADENKEIMHGLGIRSSSHGIQNPGQASIESHGSCPHAVTATRLERDHFSVTESVMQPIWALFGEKAKVLVSRKYMSIHGGGISDESYFYFIVSS